ncbi:hypothetical protein C8R44DRAFT_802863 [Mycena epipterygia]|nr:hypothetical protein C8R44DRAFT_802863 [Mycena epipterygia]
MINQVLCATSAVSTAYLRTTAFLFVRMLPLGYQFMPKIAGAFAISVTSFMVSRQTQRSSRSSKGKPGILRSAWPILFGTYSRGNPLASFAGLLLNIFAFLAYIDFIYRSHVLHRSESLTFSRTGYVDSSSARIVLRVPQIQHPFHFTYAGLNNSEAKTINIPALTEDSDYTATLELTGLTSAATLKNFTVISTSCQKPFYPYSPLSHSLAIPGLSHLARYVESEPPELVLFLGGFHLDLPVQIEPLTTRFYRQLYRQIYASSSWTRTLRDLPWIHIFDDHELVNDYYPEMTEGQVMYSHGMYLFEYYQRAANPPRANRDAHKVRRKGSRTMLGSERLKELLLWIYTEKGWKVVVSGVPMTRVSGDEMDSRIGYLEEREVIFQALWRVGGGVIVSGDRHEHATVKFPPPVGYPESHTIVEFSTRSFANTSHDETIFNLPQGSSKFGQFTLDSSREEWTIVFDLVVDGEKPWKYEHAWKKA